MSWMPWQIENSHLLLRVELAQDGEHALVVAQVLRRAAADAHHGFVVRHAHVVEGQVRFDGVPGAFLVGVPPGLEVVHHEVQPPLRRRGDVRLISGFLKPLHGEPRLVALAAVAGDDENPLAHVASH